MLREEDLRVTQGRTADPGGFIHLLHTPTGIYRSHYGPLIGVSVHDQLKAWQQEIEAELLSRGLEQFIVPAFQQKSNWQSRS